MKRKIKRRTLNPQRLKRKILRNPRQLNLKRRMRKLKANSQLCKLNLRTRRESKMIHLVELLIVSSQEMIADQETRTVLTNL